MRNAHRDGPTFVLLVRPETRLRQGLGDHLVDVVPHVGLAPIYVVLNRLGSFSENPETYLRPELGLNVEQRQLFQEFLLTMKDRIPKEDAFVRFIKSAAGDSVRSRR